MAHYISVVRLRLTYTTFILLLVSADVQSQIFPDLLNQDLFDAVVEEYKPNFVEVYSSARESMYRDIYNVNDSVNTLYSGHKLYLPPEEELPIQFLAMNASSDGINAEHIYPRSKGAKEEYGNAFSDLHNLAPARWEVNEARSNFAFSEIDDHITDCWFYKSDKIRDRDLLPEDMVHSYAEVEGVGQSFGYFEPKEDAKGDVARAIFYFYTMYRSEALREDPNFFHTMREDLCSWHNEDPVDEIEMERNLKKAAIQDGKSNPFILDCSLVNRMYCPDVSASSCSNLTTSIDDSFLEGEELNPKVKIYPNPSQGIFTLDISNISPGKYKVDIYAMSGQLIYSLNEKLDYFNSINMWNAKNGSHIIHLTNKDTGRKYSGLFEIIR